MRKTLIINLTDEGTEVAFEGVENYVECLGLIELAKDVIKSGQAVENNEPK